MESYDQNSEYASEFIGRRKGRKLLAEKRRRSRINTCLSQIKDIVCETQMRNDPNYEKMEKAEILETTVNYLRNVRKINTTPRQIKETVQVRFQQGFSKCAEEILTYIQSLPGVSDNVQHQLRKHLSGRLTHIQQVPVTASTQVETTQMTQWQERLQPVPSHYRFHSFHAYKNSPVCATPVRNSVTLNDSGYGDSPNSVRFQSEDKKQCYPENLSDSELCNLYSRKQSSGFDDSRVRAWVQSTLSYSQQVKMEQQAPWRPW